MSITITFMLSFICRHFYRFILLTWIIWVCLWIYYFCC